jgi:hypothetical protein
MEQLKTTELEDYLDLFREFETKKRSIRPKQTNKVVITLPVALTDLVKKQHKQFAIELTLMNSNVRSST